MVQSILKTPTKAKEPNFNPCWPNEQECIQLTGSEYAFLIQIPKVKLFWEFF